MLGTFLGGDVRRDILKLAVFFFLAIYGNSPRDCDSNKLLYFTGIGTCGLKSK